MSSRHFINRFEDGSIETSELNRISLAKQGYDMLKSCTKNQTPMINNHDGGIYVGFVGHVYALLHLSTSPLLSESRMEMLKLARHIIEQDIAMYAHRGELQESTTNSFLLGKLGSIALAVCVYDQLDQVNESKKYINEFIAMGERFLKIDLYSYGSDELFVGRAGYIAGLFLIVRYTKPTSFNFPKSLLYRILDTIVQSGQQYSQKHRSRSTLMYAYYGTEYFGAGHGLVGILMALLKSKEYLSDRVPVCSIIQESLDYLISIIDERSGNIAPAAEDLNAEVTPDTQLIHWCHGAPGAVFVFARAYVLWKNDSYLRAAMECGEAVWKYGLLKKGPGLCHGVAGNGYVFLTLFRLTGDGKYLYRAKCFFDFLSKPEFKPYLKKPDCPYSLFEGLAGTACFVADLANPTESYFPFFDVFEC